METQNQQSNRKELFLCPKFKELFENFVICEICEEKDSCFTFNWEKEYKKVLRD